MKRACMVLIMLFIVIATGNQTLAEVQPSGGGGGQPETIFSAHTHSSTPSKK